MKAWILTHFEPYEDRDVHGVFLSEAAGHSFIEKWVKFCLDLNARLPEIENLENDSDAWHAAYEQREAMVDQAVWPNGISISQYSLKSAESWLELVETELLE